MTLVESRSVTRLVRRCLASAVHDVPAISAELSYIVGERRRPADRVPAPRTAAAFLRSVHQNGKKVGVDSDAPIVVKRVRRPPSVVEVTGRWKLWRQGSVDRCATACGRP